MKLILMYTFVGFSTDCGKDQVNTSIKGTKEDLGDAIHKLVETNFADSKH